jgi:chitinase
VRAKYADRSHTAATDRWVVFHLHIDLDELTFLNDKKNYYVGVKTMHLYHSQGIRRPPPVTPGGPSNYRAEFRLSNGYAKGRYNKGSLQNYNDRVETLTCNFRQDGRWYPGNDRSATIRGLGETQRGLLGYAEALNEFVSRFRFPLYFLKTHQPNQLMRTGRMVVRSRYLRSLQLGIYMANPG